MRKLLLVLAGSALSVLTLAAAQTPAFFPINDVRPGMVGIGRTVFEGDKLEEFRANIVGVLRNVIGPGRDLILARLEGGPLANTGVVAGMSGSPVYIDGKLVGAVSYSIGSFPKEPLAGITPIAEMTGAVDAPSDVRPSGRGLAMRWPASQGEVYAALARVAARAQWPLGEPSRDLRVVGPATLADLAPALRPIGAAMVVSGFDPAVDHDLRQALAIAGTGDQSSRSTPPAATAALRPGEAVGMAVMRGDLEMGATGTVTHVDGNKVYAFGHPFLNLGPTAFAMTRARVVTTLPSLDSSIKIAALGPVIGTMSQDRATAVGGTLGALPNELETHITLSSARTPSRSFTFYVIHDQLLTPLYTYVAVLNALVSYERQVGTLSVGAKGTMTFDNGAQVSIDDVFSGDGALTGTAGAIASPIGRVMDNEFRQAVPTRLDLELRAAEREDTTTIERAWLDTTRPRLGATHTLQVQLRDFRGASRTISMPVTMPAQADGPITLLVSDAATLTQLEQKDLDPGKPTSWTDLVADLNKTRRNNRLYVRLIASTGGSVVGGETLPALPVSVRSVLDADATVSRAAVSRSIVGAWEQRLDVAVRGSRELSITLTPRQ